MIDLTPRVARLVDRAALLRLGFIGMDEAPAIPPAPQDPRTFWRGTRVLAPATVTGRHVAGVPASARIPGATRPRIVDLSGPSRGPGGHWGASHLQARAYLAPDPSAPLILILHGYAAPNSWYEDRLMQRIVNRGLSAARLELPFHLSRRLPRRSAGAGFFSGDPLGTLAVLAQATEDAAAVIEWARTELGVATGVLGVSLGGLVGALLAAHVELDGAILVTPACDLVEISLNHAPARVRRRLDLLDGRGGVWAADHAQARPLLTDALAPVTPAALRPATDPARMVIVRALHDQVVGTEPVRRLADSWGVECWSYAHGHCTVMTAGGLVSRALGRLAVDLGAVATAGPASLTG